MVKKYIVTVVDDLDESSPATTVHFSCGGLDYEIDLSDAHATQLRTDFEPYVQAARVVGRYAPRSMRSFEALRLHRQRARAWLRVNGFEVGNRGRLPRDLLQQYELAQKRAPQRAGQRRSPNG